MCQRREARRSLSACLADVDTTQGRKRVSARAATRPFPHFEASELPGLLVKIGADGTRTIGRFVNRQFRSTQQPK
jgi:hypothetical protein